MVEQKANEMVAQMVASRAVLRVASKDEVWVGRTVAMMAVLKVGSMAVE